MKNNYKIVAITPSGRKSYLEILYKYISKNKHILDRWDLWVNTENPSDLAYIKELSNNDSFINLVYPDWPYEKGCPNLSLAPFWSKATDEDTIYIRFDDDIVFIADNTIEKLVDFRIQNKEYFFIYPFIINNSFHSKELQNRGIVDTKHGIIRTYQELCILGPSDPVSLTNPLFARDLHEDFINSYNKNEHYKYMCNEKIVWDVFETKYIYNTNKTSEVVTNGGPQVSINCVCWFGSIFKEICPINNCYFANESSQRELTDEEAYLTIVKTKELGLPSCTIPDTLVVHFLFGPQRSQDTMGDILQKYNDIANV